MMDARYKSLGVLKQIVKTCNNFPADSYGKVVLCGDSGAGKSTLTQVSQMLQAWRLWRGYCFESQMIFYVS